MQVFHFVVKTILFHLFAMSGAKHENFSEKLFPLETYHYAVDLVSTVVAVAFCVEYILPTRWTKGIKRRKVLVMCLGVIIVYITERSYS